MPASTKETFNKWKWHWFQQNLHVLPRKHTAPQYLTVWTSVLSCIIPVQISLNSYVGIKAIKFIASHFLWTQSVGLPANYFWRNGQSVVSQVVQPETYSFSITLFPSVLPSPIPLTKTYCSFWFSLPAKLMIWFTALNELCLKISQNLFSISQDCKLAFYSSLPSESWTPPSHGHCSQGCLWPLHFQPCWNLGYREYGMVNI